MTSNKNSGERISKDKNNFLRYQNREENPVVFFDITATLNNELPTLVGRLYFELRSDLVPLASANFLLLVSGVKGIGADGINYSYKGTKLHRVCRDIIIQGGDLLNESGNCSRSAVNDGGLFKDENFLLRHTGPGVISMCNSGPDTNGSLFQIVMTESPDMDNIYVVFGYLVGKESYDVLQKINRYGTYWGLPSAELIISDCGVAFPKEKLK